MEQQVGGGSETLGSKQFQLLGALHAWQASYADYELNHGNACLAQAVRP